MKKLLILVCAIALVGSTSVGLDWAQSEAPIYVDPAPNGGYVMTQPGSDEPPTYIDPTPNGGSVITQPGAGADEQESDDGDDGN